MPNLAFKDSANTSKLYAAKEMLDPILRTLYLRVVSVRDHIDELSQLYCLNVPLCEHLALADWAIASYLRAAEFLNNPHEKPPMSPRELAYKYRDLIRILFELHPPILELIKPVFYVAVMKDGSWETLQFKLTLALMELERMLEHPQFMEHAMAVEEFVLAKH